jgi:hypothetical protein
MYFRIYILHYISCVTKLNQKPGLRVFASLHNYQPFKSCQQRDGLFVHLKFFANNMFVSYVNNKPELCTYLQDAEVTRVAVYLHSELSAVFAVLVMLSPLSLAKRQYGEPLLIQFK